MAEAFRNNLISPDEAEKLLRAHDADCTLLWLWMAYTGSQDKERAAGELCMTMAQVENAFEKLSRMMLPVPAVQGVPSLQSAPGPSLPPEKPEKKPVAPAEELPEYTVAEIDACLSADSAFRAVLDEAEQMLGKQLTRHDTGRLLGIYEHLGLPAEVIFVLLHYCADISRGRDGERKPTMYFIERQAYAWANSGIQTMEAAEEYAEKEKALRSDLGRVKTLLEIYDRKLTPTETNNIKAWLSMGFSDDAIELAYHRTVDQTGKRSLPYMNTILLRWNEAGLHTLREVEAAEPSGKSGRVTPGKKPRGGHGPFVPTEF